MITHSIILSFYLIIKRAFKKCNLIFVVFINLEIITVPVTSFAQDILFDFDNAPIYTSLPIYLTSGGITAHLSATGQGYSIQNANVLGFTPAGFSGRILYPNSIYLADFLVRFNQPITDFSIMYCCQELGCDDAATMKVTAFMNGSYVGFSTRTATFPGTWPVDTLRCSFPQGFDSVVVHYFSHPPTCQDYGTIFMADNMRVTSLPVSISTNEEHPENFLLLQNYPNPFNPVTKIKYILPKNGFVKLVVFDVLGNLIKILVNEGQSAGTHEIKFNSDNLPSGIYFYKLETENFSSVRKMIIFK